MAPAAATSTPPENPFLDVFNAETGDLEWRSPDLGGPYQQLVLLRVAADRGALYVLSADSQTVDLQTPDLEIQALDTADLDGDGVKEVVVGDRDGFESGDTSAWSATIP